MIYLNSFITLILDFILLTILSSYPCKLF